jgi:hypothetical protein
MYDINEEHAKAKVLLATALQRLQDLCPLAREHHGDSDPPKPA